MNDVRQLVDELKIGTEQFRTQQDIIIATYSKIIVSLNKTQENYAESLKVYIDKLQNDMETIQSANDTVKDLLYSTTLFGGKAVHAVRQMDSLSQLIRDTEGGLKTWSAETKTEIKNIHQQAGKNIFWRMKLFILINTVGTIGTFALIFFFFYRTGIFQLLNH